MLVFMTFSFWLCLAITLGMTFGYYLFSDRFPASTKRSSNEIKTCCD
ncbi:unnamed protein product [Enterobius vermicularis]|uniref:Copper transporter n=1 Tax=Enterobius vermicularis TaxID=51028 RepID=A0A0N4UVR9_ENTVE|nr:unnamed protein product [Enterobius vermicularis]